MGTRLVSWPNITASSIAPAATTASTISELVPAAASTAGIVNTPVPMMLPITSPVAEVRPSPPLCSWLADDTGWADDAGWAGSSRGCGAGRAPVVLDIDSPSRKYAPPHHAGAGSFGWI